MPALNPDQYTVYTHVLDRGCQGITVPDLACVCYESELWAQQVLNRLVELRQVVNHNGLYIACYRQWE